MGSVRRGYTYQQLEGYYEVTPVVLEIGEELSNRIPINKGLK